MVASAHHFFETFGWSAAIELLARSKVESRMGLRGQRCEQPSSCASVSTRIWPHQVEIVRRSSARIR